MRDDSESLPDPVLAWELVDRPADDVPDQDNMWDQLVDLCETDGDLDAVIAMRKQAEERT